MFPQANKIRVFDSDVIVIVIVIVEGCSVRGSARLDEDARAAAAGHVVRRSLCIKKEKKK